MQQVVIENPILNSPFIEPSRHFRFTDEGITNEITDGHRVSSYFVPIARPRKKGQKQLNFDTEWTKDRIEENKLVNQIRTRVRRQVRQVRQPPRGGRGRLCHAHAENRDHRPAGGWTYRDAHRSDESSRRAHGRPTSPDAPASVLREFKRIPHQPVLSGNTPTKRKR